MRTNANINGAYPPSTEWLEFKKRKGYFPYAVEKGWLIDEVPKDALSELDIIVDQIKDNNDLYPLYTKKLAGSIDKEYKVEMGDNVKKYVTQLIRRYEKESGGFLQNNYSKLFSNNRVNLTFSDHFWVNFQQKYEYNPLHVHNGLFSFVIWHTVPYYIEDETKKGPGSNKQLLMDNFNENGCFSFAWHNGVQMQTHEMPVDKTWEGKICLFPADLNHQVFPFYTSDDYRISFSGNIFLEGTPPPPPQPTQINKRHTNW